MRYYLLLHYYCVVCVLVLFLSFSSGGSRAGSRSGELGETPAATTTSFGAVPASHAALCRVCCCAPGKAVAERAVHPGPQGAGGERFDLLLFLFAVPAPRPSSSAGQPQGARRRAGSAGTPGAGGAGTDGQL